MKRLMCYLLGHRPAVESSRHVEWDFSRWCERGRAVTTVVNWRGCQRCGRQLSETWWKTTPGVDQ